MTMIILVLNAGSSSLKYELFKNGANGKLTSLYEGIIDRIGVKGSPVKDHGTALKAALKAIIDLKIIKKLSQITAIGHRVVHGGEMKQAVVINKAVLNKLKKITELAPLHNPANLAAIKSCMGLLKGKKNVAVFDTAFHQTIPEKAYLYAIPYEYYKKHGIRRYGFHGTSHLYVSKKVSTLMKKKNIRLVVCHMGNGSSVTAIKNGISVDTSMGFTPLEGLPMGTRCGDIDPAIVYKLMEKFKLSVKEIDNILNKESGLKALSGISSDMRDLWRDYITNKRARLAISILAYKTAKYIAGYSAALGGLDAVAFTAGIGQKAYYVRAEICDYLKHFGLKLDDKKNKACAEKISASNSKVQVFVIPTDEELEIAYQTRDLLKM